MLLTTEINTRWNAKTKSHYESMGYEYTFMGDELIVSVHHLKDSSAEQVDIRCDYCKNIFTKRWHVYKSQSSIVNTDACTHCKHLKAKDSVREKYGVDNVMQLEEFKEYGDKNRFSFDSVKNKIRNTMIKKYGKPSFTQTKEYNIKRKKTSLERYGYESHMKSEHYREMFTGENNPVWKGGIHDERWDRLQPKYREWRINVFSRDSFICVKCNKHSKSLQAHHIRNWKDNPDVRYDVENGITLCEKCHSKFHRIYGKKNNTLVQLLEFLER